MTADGDRLPRMVRVSKNRRCIVCGRPDWCLVQPDFLRAMCCRVPSEKPTAAGWLHKFDQGRCDVQAPAVDWEARCAGWATALTDARRRMLEEALGVPAGASRGLPGIGWNRDANGDHWTFPMRDGAGKVVGVSRRYGDGRKLSLGSNGLFVPAWRGSMDLSVLYVVEGASDAMAMTAGGLAAVGRPSNAQGAEAVVGLVRRLTPVRTVVVMGENDQKDDGAWPGLSGMSAVADQVRAALNRDRPPAPWRVLMRLPPDGHKDVREYFTVCDAWEYTSLFVAKMRLGETGVL